MRTKQKSIIITECELRPFVSVYIQRSDDQPQARYLNQTLAISDKSSANALSSRYSNASTNPPRQRRYGLVARCHSRLRNLHPFYFVLSSNFIHTQQWMNECYNLQPIFKTCEEFEIQHSSPTLSSAMNLTELTIPTFKPGEANGPAALLVRPQSSLLLDYS